MNISVKKKNGLYQRKYFVATILLILRGSTTSMRLSWTVELLTVSYLELLGVLPEPHNVLVQIWCIKCSNVPNFQLSWTMLVSVLLIRSSDIRRGYMITEFGVRES